MALKVAAIFYFIGLGLLPASGGGWLTPSMACFYVTAFAVGLHLARNAQRLGAGNRLGMLACRASPVALPLLAAGVRWVGNAYPFAAS